MAISVKTTWQDGETVFAADINRIETNIKELETGVKSKVERSEDQTIVATHTFQSSKGIKIRRSISGSWYQNQVLPLDVIINGENSAGMVFNRNDTDLAQLAFNQHGIMLRVIATNTKHTVIHTGNLDLITAAAAATLED